MFLSQLLVKALHVQIEILFPVEPKHVFRGVGLLGSITAWHYPFTGRADRSRVNWTGQVTR